MAQYLLDVLYSLTTCMSCFPSSPNLAINGRSFKILSLLGEGGFSYVYLVQDTDGKLYALKKIRCPFGQESVSKAVQEAEHYRRFAHPNLIKAVDYAIVSSSGRGSTTIGTAPGGADDGGEKTVYILLPYFPRGNLQDAINANLVNHTAFPTKKLLRLFLGVCQGIKALHEHRLRSPGEVRAGVSDPLMNAADAEAGEEGTLRAFVHRDIKPGNVMIADDGETPVVMDFGSLAPSPISVTSRALALEIQDHAAENSTMPYRPPELFDVKTGSVLDDKVDIWSLGATLFCALYGHSPFELETEESGGSLALAICSGSYQFPEAGRLGARKPGQPPVPESVKDIVKMCLKVEPVDRPDINGLIKEVERVIGELPDDEE
ncbi:kinase-like protein [Ascodesmis nigricans]|uniref:non-specific serine/threonine protein kinase n=1 Tax=Ascodesmis nigricans TaxID=341454 RepID=A0A4S2N707_9PEZI|nr:kinase-like protein [Ascodesmis nigricans]